MNSKIKIDSAHRYFYSKQNNTQLSIMSFNLRFKNDKDKQQYSWDNRKDNVQFLILSVTLMKSMFPDIIGVQ